MNQNPNIPEGFRRNRPGKRGRQVGEIIAELAKRGRVLLPDAPEPCETCAFRESTFPNGCLGTTAMAFNCALKGAADPFMCHEYVVDGVSQRECAGWVLAKEAAASIPPGPVRDKMRLARTMAAVEAMCGGDDAEE